jgi:hypothetical protein
MSIRSILFLAVAIIIFSSLTGCAQRTYNCGGGCNYDSVCGRYSCTSPDLAPPSCGTPCFYTCTGGPCS